MVAKIQDNRLIYPKKLEIIDGKQVSNPTDEILLANGWLEVVEPTLLENQSKGTPYEENGKIYFEVVDGINPRPFVNTIEIKKQMWNLFAPKVIQLAPYQFTIEQNIDSNNGIILKEIANGLKNAGLVNQKEVDAFLTILTENGINLLDY